MQLNVYSTFLVEVVLVDALHAVLFLFYIFFPFEYI